MKEYRITNKISLYDDLPKYGFTERRYFNFGESFWIRLADAFSGDILMVTGDWNKRRISLVPFGVVTEDKIIDLLEAGIVEIIEFRD